MARSGEQLRHDETERYNLSNDNENSCVQQKIFFFVSGVVKSKKILKGKLSFFAKRNRCRFRLSCYLLQTGYIELMV